MVKNSMYSLISSVIKKEKECKQIGRIDTFWLYFIVSGALLVIGVFVFIANVIVAGLSKDIESVQFVLYAWYFGICLLVIICAAIYGFSVKVFVTEEEIMFRAKTILKDLRMSQNLKQYEINHPLIVRSKDQLEEYINGLEKLTNLIKT